MTYYCRIVDVFKGKVLIGELYNIESSRGFERIGVILVFLLCKEKQNQYHRDTKIIFCLSEAGTEYSGSLTFMNVWVQRRDFKNNIALFPLSR